MSSGLDQGNSFSVAPYAIAFQLQALSLGVTCVAGVVSVSDKSDNAIHSDQRFNNIKP